MSANSTLELSNPFGVHKVDKKVDEERRVTQRMCLQPISIQVKMVLWLFTSYESQVALAKSNTDGTT